MGLRHARIDRGILSAAIVALLTAPVTSSAQLAQPGQAAGATDATTPSSAPTSQPSAAPAASGQGFVQCVVFAGRRMTLIAGATVEVIGGESAQTDARGSVFLRAAPGARRVHIEIPVERLPEAPAGATGSAIAEIPDVPVVAGEITRAFVVASADGDQVAFDMRAPPPPAAAPAGAAPQAEQQAMEPGATGPTGTISGNITSVTGEPVPGAKIIVLSTDAETQTDQEGRFALTLPEGDYTISIVHADYIGQTFEGVMVAAGQDNPITAQLTPAPAEMEDYVVRGTRIRGSLATVMQERRESAAVTDAIGVEDIRRSPDGTASAATRRVVGATVVGGQFLYVRGLGGRYSNVRLNGVPLPSTDPDLPGFQLDLFPASLLSSLTISKTFTPDIPGDFAGGSMNIVTRDFPPHFDLSGSVSLGSDSETIGRKALSYAGGKTDWLGFDDGTRKLPDAVPHEKVIAGRRGMGLDLKEVDAAGREFADRWALHPTTALPNLAIGFSIGNTTRLGDHRFGYLATLGYRYSWSRYIEKITNVQLANDTSTKDPDDKKPALKEKLEREVGFESAQIGALGTVSYEIAKGHELTAVSVLTQTADDKAAFVTGSTYAEGRPVQQTQLAFVERQLLFEQLLGHHDLSSVLVDWQLNIARIQRNTPDLRNVIYAESGDDFAYLNDTGERIFTELQQDDLGGGANLTIPIDQSKLQAGYLGRISDQDFWARRFRYKFIGKPDDRLLDVEDLFAPSNSGALWRLDEKTRDDDGYTAKQSLHAGYGLADVPVTEWWRLTGGARVESFHQTIDVEPPITVTNEEDLPHAKHDDLDVLPSGGMIFSLSEQMAIRLAYGGTVARPLVRELAPFLNQDFVRRRTVTGDPDLKRTYINNFDVRWEMFPSKTEVLAASLFYKTFSNPIETSVLNPQGDLSYQNIDGAHNYGFELEARTSLERIAPALRDFMLQANFAMIRSRVSLSEEQQMFATSKVRPMAGQSPYVANLSLGYSPADTPLSLTIFYNVFGRRIVEVGRLQLPDVYEEPFHSVDLSGSYQVDEHWTLGVAATNLLFQQVVLHQGPFEFSRINKGAWFAVRVGFVN